jgi:guanylate kinase
LNNFKITRAGILFVISAPSGAGKTTLIHSLRQNQDFIYSVSCTTRSPRLGEVHGEHYFFMSDEEFQSHIAAGDFLEHAEVHGRFYGTLKSNVIAHLKQGTDVLLDVDTVGAASIRACEDPIIQAALADVFIMPPGLDEISRRLSRIPLHSRQRIEGRGR